MRTFLAAAVTCSTTLFMANAAFAQGFDNREWMSNWGWGHMAFGGLMMVVFWGGIVLLMVLLARGLGGGERREALSRQSPMDILQERFAKGEIDQIEYDERRRALSGTP